VEGKRQEEMEGEGSLSCRGFGTFARSVSIMSVFVRVCVMCLCV